MSTGIDGDGFAMIPAACVRDRTLRSTRWRTSSSRSLASKSKYQPRLFQPPILPLTCGSFCGSPGRFTGHYPDRITVVGYGMKRARYEDVHRAAIRWPMDKFEYIGIDNEGDTTADYEGEVRASPRPLAPSPFTSPFSHVSQRERA
jgi:hypothetical protein